MIRELQKHLLNRPAIARVYFDHNGQYLFHARAEYPITKTRDEVLEMEAEDEPEPIAKTEENIDNPVVAKGKPGRRPAVKEPEVTEEIKTEENIDNQQ